MSITELPFFSMLKTRMGWHQARQSVLADNVANADTPGFRGRDLRSPDFGRSLAARVAGPEPLAPRLTAAGHVAGRPMMSRASAHATEKAEVFETTPRGNAVVLEEEMMKVAANQMDFQAATSLYERGLGLLRTAIGRRA